MTYRQKLLREHPDKVYEAAMGGCEGCPGNYGYSEELDSHTCLGASEEECHDCWDQEMPEEDTPTIEDSGDRTKFPSGAVRDMRVGKGRFDISPLEVVSHMIDPDGDSILDSIADFVRTQNTVHLYDALNTFTAAYYNQMETLLLEVAVHFEEGAKKYGDANYKKGIPTNCYIDSAVRHYLKWLRGDKNERHDRALCWNLMCCIWEVDYHKYD